MDKDKIQKCKNLARRYNSMYQSTERDELRNRLFIEMKDDFMKWITSINKDRGIFKNSKDILSTSFYCFMLGLKNYKANGRVPFQNHFYSYTWFYLLSRIKKEVEKEEYQEGKHGVVIDPGVVFENIDELKQLKKSLPGEYHSVLEDALRSMNGENSERLKRTEETPLHYYRYLEAKKLLKIFVDFLIRR